MLSDVKRFQAISLISVRGFIAIAFAFPQNQSLSDFNKSLNDLCLLCGFKWFRWFPFEDSWLYFSPFSETNRLAILSMLSDLMKFRRRHRSLSDSKWLSLSSDFKRFQAIWAISIRGIMAIWPGSRQQNRLAISSYFICWAIPSDFKRFCWFAVEGSWRFIMLPPAKSLSDSKRVQAILAGFQSRNHGDSACCHRPNR